MIGNWIISCFFVNESWFPVRLRLQLGDSYVHRPMEDVNGSIFHMLLCLPLWPVVASWTGSYNATLSFLVST